MNTKRRLHIHMSVDSIEKSIPFYTTQFGAEPSKVKEDYAQWLVDDLSLNFSISTRGYEKGLNHLGVQYESDEALLKAQMLFENNGIKGKEDKGAVGLTCRDEPAFEKYINALKEKDVEKMINEVYVPIV